MGISYSRDRNRKHQSHIKQLPIDPAYVLPSFAKPNAVDLPWSLTSEVSELKSYTPLKSRTPGWIDEKQEVKDANYPTATPLEVIVDKTIMFPEPSNIEILKSQAIARVRSTEVSSKPQYQLNVRRSHTFDSQRGRSKSVPVRKESEPSVNFKCGIRRRSTSRQSPFDRTSLQQTINPCDINCHDHCNPLQSSNITEESSQRDIYSRRKHSPVAYEISTRNRTSHYANNSRIPRRAASSYRSPSRQDDCTLTLGDPRPFLQKPNQKSPTPTPQFSQHNIKAQAYTRTNQPVKKQPCVSFLSQPSYVPISSLESKRNVRRRSREHDWLLCGHSLVAAPKSSSSSLPMSLPSPSRISRSQKRTTTTITSISMAAPSSLCAASHVGLNGVERRLL